ncbi:MAG: bifunctional metallophosphatase/5'-nucleotidase [Candidatus Eisenbacteria bacterium]|nr:bifunctional metallophosphatase/5'-nucleotidase [Candidatus Eisenbacteria bacterium]
MTLAGVARADRLVFLHTNDTHSHLDVFDNFHRGQHHPGTGGVAKRATLVKAIRAEGAPVVLLDAGDVFQGTPFFNFYHGRMDYDAMNRLGYAVGTLGNHDLDDGYAHFRKLRGLRNFPVISANVDAPDSAGGSPIQICPSDTILLVGAHKIGLFGITTERLLEIVSRSRNPGLRVRPAIPAAREEVRRLRSAGVDIVVAMSHLGFDEDKVLADSVQGIDLVIGGHSHSFLSKLTLVHKEGAANGWGGTGIVQTGSYGINLGRLDVDFDGATPTAVAYRLIPVDSAVVEDPEMVAWMQPYKAGVDSAVSIVVGEAAADFSNSAERKGETTLGNLVAEVLRQYTGADVGLQNSGGIRTSLPKGPIRAGDIYSMLPFDNEVVRIELTGAQLLEVFDFIAGKGGKGGSGQISGARMVATAAGAESVTVGGMQIDAARIYVLATTDFLASGGNGFDMLAKGKISPVGNGVFLRDAMITYIRKNGPIKPVMDGSLKYRE